MAPDIQENTPSDTNKVIAPETRLLIFLLGEFLLKKDDEVISLKTPSYQALLAYLLIHAGQAHPRRHLAYKFWPDSTEAQARTNLRKALYRIRQTLPDAGHFLLIEPDTIQWRPDAPCTVDVWEFETAVEQSSQTKSPALQQRELQRAINAYNGDFLPGHYDDWVLTAREKFRRRYQTALEEQLALLENQRQYPAAIKLARKLLREDPLHEAAYRRLMRLQSLDGDVAGALRTYHTCSTNLQRELGVDPGPTTKEVYERLLDLKAPPMPLTPARLPLVARDEAWQKLQATWKDCARGKPAVALLSGEAGIGKTRLAEELLDWAQRQGVVSLTAVCYPSEKQLAYAPLAKWLRHEQLQPVFDRLPKRQLAAFSRLLPELQIQHPGLPDPGPFTESWQRQHFFSVLAQTLLQLAQPFLLFVDDFPSCDQDSLDWLHYLLHYQAQPRFLLLGAARSEEIMSGDSLDTWQQQLEKEGRLKPINLGRLGVHDSAQLASHVLKRSLDQEEVIHLYTETEGNPLFVVEMARAGLDTRLPADQLLSLSPRVQAIIETRLASLSPSAYRLAQLAAVIGRSFTFPLLNQACTQSEESVIRSVDELWQRRLIRERGFDAYDFSHDKIRQAAYASLSQARRRQFHKQVWQALEKHHADDLGPVSGQIAAHCEASGNYQEAIAYYRQAAKAAQAIYANQDTLDYLQKAVDLFTRAEAATQQQLEIYEQLGDVLTTIGRYEEAEAAFVLTAPLAAEPVAQSRVFRKIANTWQLRRQHEKAFAAWQSGENCMGKPSVDWPDIYWQEWLWINLEKSWVLYWTNRLPELESLLKEIHPIMEKRGTASQRGLHYQRFVWLSFRRDHFVLPDETVAHAQSSLAIIQEYGTQTQIAFAQFVLGLTLYHHGWLGDFEEAERHMKIALKQAQELGDIVLQIRCLIHLSQNYLRHGDLDSAGTYITQALALARKADSLEYVLMGTGLESWYAWKMGNFVEAQRLGERALELASNLSFGWPGKWVVAFPLISIALAQNGNGLAVEYARMMFDPGQMRLHDELSAVLQQAIEAWENKQPDAAQVGLRQALQLAQKYHYL